MMIYLIFQQFVCFHCNLSAIQKKYALPEPIIKELQGGIEVCIFKSESNKELLKINSSDQIRNDFGMISERFRNSFVNETIDKNSLLETNSEVFLIYLRDNFGITSEKLRESFWITSGKEIAKPILTR